jgi:hypothetical protein
LDQLIAASSLDQVHRKGYPAAAACAAHDLSDGPPTSSFAQALIERQHRRADVGLSLHSFVLELGDLAPKSCLSVAELTLLPLPRRYDLFTMLFRFGEFTLRGVDGVHGLERLVLQFTSMFLQAGNVHLKVFQLAGIEDLPLVQLLLEGFDSLS